MKCCCFPAWCHTGQNKRAGKKERVGAQQGAQGTYSLTERPLESFQLAMQFQFGGGGEVLE